MPAAPKPPAHPVTPPGFQLPTPVAAYSGSFGPQQAERLLWRAGFGPSPGHAQALAALGLHRAVASLTRPVGQPVLTGDAAVDDDGNPLAPADIWGHDHLWWLDRMVRTSQPLVERMTLVWHDWFATSLDGVAHQNLMLIQNALFRRSALGSFRDLALAVTADPAMIVWLNMNNNTRVHPNENYARELMELFTLGANRGAYTETDVRELARALTGWTYGNSSAYPENFHHDPSRHDPGVKTIFGQTGAFGWDTAVGMCIANPKHPSHFVEKLWGYFIPVAPTPADRLALERTYVASGYQVRPVLEAILLHPQLHAGPGMPKPPVVFVAGMLRALRQAIDTEDWWWLCQTAGQRLFIPPDVAGWGNDRWLDTGTVRGRWLIVERAMRSRYIRGTDYTGYDDTETPDQAVAKARAFWGNPGLTTETVAELTSFAASCVNPGMPGWQQRQYRAGRQNALRQLVWCSPDLQVS